MSLMSTLHGRVGAALATLVLVPLALASLDPATAADADTSTLTAPPSGSGTTTVTWSGSTTGTGQYLGGPCTAAYCQPHTLVLDVPANYWSNHEGSVTVDLTWADSSNDLDLEVDDASGANIGESIAGDTTSEHIDLGKLEPGTYTVQTRSALAPPGTAWTASATLTSTEVSPSMIFPESRETLLDELVQEYPLRVIFVGRTPTAAEVAELKASIPDTYKPTVSTKSATPGELDPEGASGLLNWNKAHYLPGENPYFLGITYKYKLQILTASADYAKALYQVAEDHTARDQSYQDQVMTAQQVKYDSSFGKYRLLAKAGDPTFAVTDPSKQDLVDAYAVEDWMFESRTDPRWSCAFTDVETGQCVPAGVIQDSRNAYHDPYYDKFGLNLDTMPQGVNKGSSYFFFDTFTPSYAKDYFRSNAYHVWGTDKVINGAIVPKAVEDGGSWRVTDPDAGSWRGVDFARTWGGRYRFHFFDLGAAPNSYEDATWANYGAGMSSEYPYGDPPVWQYAADPLWQQQGDTCQDAAALHYTGNTPCRMMPRLGRDVAYGLFFRSTAGYLYRPIPKGDTNWLAANNWTDFYSRPQWVKDPTTGLSAPTSAPWYGNWWSDLHKLYKIDDVTKTPHDDTLRWLSAATPYARWVGRVGETIPLYDPTTNQPTGETLDVSPKFADLPAPDHHVSSSLGEVDVVPEPLATDEHVHVKYGDKDVDLTGLSNAIEKAKAYGLAGASYDFSVNTDVMRQYVDAHEEGIADRVPGVNTMPSLNLVFEKVWTWGLPVIAGGVSIDDGNNEAWGVVNNVNDRFKWCGANYPLYDPATSKPGDPVSLLPCHPKQETGTGFSYTIEHEAAHSLGLSHPHDGSYGVDKCPAGDPNAGKWECYWTGLGWVMDISAAPTTYAMDYRPYEVEDQDNLQRGHIAEYLLSAQESLRAKLTAEAATGATMPSADYQARFAEYTQWKAKAVSLFKVGDYLHGEYAARNAAIAAKGFPPAGRTVDPRLVGAGQVFYFNVHPQSTLGLKRLANLKVGSLTATQPKPKETVLTASVTNDGGTDAGGVVVRFSNGTSTIGSSAPVAVPAGSTVDVAVTWATKAISGVQTVTAEADPANAVIEEDETDNTLTRQVTVRGNLVPNWSFEAGLTAPTSWTAGSGTRYLTNDSHAQDGSDLVSIQAALLGKKPASGATWTSSTFPVTAGRQYGIATGLQAQGLSSVPSLTVVYLDAKNKQVGSTNLLGPGQTFAAQDVIGSSTAPATAKTARIVLRGFSSVDPAPAGVAWFDSVWMW
jgi:hypothetical protein